MNEKIMVLCFHKMKYKRETLENMSDSEKYSVAMADTDGCSIMDRNDYTRNLNDFKPMDSYVYTYIVTVPMAAMYSNEYK